VQRLEEVLQRHKNLQKLRGKENIHMLLGDLLTRSAKWYANKTATVYGETRLTYEQINRRTNALANALQELGIKHQERVAIVCHNSHHCLEIVFACAKIGAVATNLNWRLSPKELGVLLNHSDARVVFFSKRFEPFIESIRHELNSNIPFIAIDGPIEGMTDYEIFIENRVTEEPTAQVHYEDTVIQMYTSGTTGTPKGVMLTHKNMISHAFNTIIELQMRRDVVYLNVLPLFHVAFFAPVNCVFLGGTNVLLPDFDLDKILATIEKERITHVGFVPALVNFLVEHPKFEQYDLSSLQLIVYAASPMPVPLLKRAMKRFNCNFAQVFGMTETSPVTHILIPEEHVLEGPEFKVRRLGSVGRSIINVRSKVVDDRGNECPVGVVGEVVDAGDTIMKGYYKMPEATAETIKDGWLHTGDMGYVDEYGYLYLADRKKDMIISGGENIYPTEVEMCILQMEGVADVAVIGIPDKDWGELVKAIVVQKPGYNLSAGEVIEHCKANIAGYKKPKSVDFIDMLPRNAVGKVQKNVLRDPYWAGREKKI